MQSNYVCAGFETLASILDRFIKGEHYNNEFTRPQINDFLKNTSNKFLHSFGQEFKDRKKIERHKMKETQAFQFCRDTEFFNDSEFIVDSGGFQISVGLLNLQKTKDLFRLYYEFLEESYDVYDKAFILDIPPGPNCEIFKGFDDVYKWNLESYQKAASMPQHVKDKIIYVHHFRTPKLWDIYTKIMRDEDMFGHFKHHATGGIVANMSSDTVIPCIIYVIPMIPLLNEAIRHGRDYLDFHILGGANYRDILFYEFFKLHVKKVHNIELNITYDSSGIFKSLMVGRTIYAYDDHIIRKMDVRTHMLDKRICADGRDVLQFYKDMINSMVVKHGLTPIDIGDSIYCEKTGTFKENVRCYSMLYMLHMYSEVQEDMRNKAAELYEMYEAGDNEGFSIGIEQVTRNINSGKITKKQRAKSTSVIRSLDMLTSLDENYCKYIIEKFLAKDEFTDLIDERRVLSI